jgi:hypothetical protein
MCDLAGKIVVCPDFRCGILSDMDVSCAFRIWAFDSKGKVLDSLREVENEIVRLKKRGCLSRHPLPLLS